MVIYQEDTINLYLIQLSVTHGSVLGYLALPLEYSFNTKEQQHITLTLKGKTCPSASMNGQQFPQLHFTSPSFHQITTNDLIGDKLWNVTDFPYYLDFFFFLNKYILGSFPSSFRFFLAYVYTKPIFF